MGFLTDAELKDHWGDSGITVKFDEPGTYHLNGRAYNVNVGDCVRLLKLVQKKCRSCHQDLPTPLGIIFGGAYDKLT